MTDNSKAGPRMNSSEKREVLQIKKYPNRRYYDATRSCHVTLHEVYELIQAGHEVVITDSRNGEDITNLVLAQVILERDQPKLDIFPASILHLVIRSNRHVLRSFVDRVFGPMMDLFATSQRQWDSYLRNTMSGRITSPFDWAQSMFGAMAPNHRNSAGTAPRSEGSPEHEVPPPESGVGTIDSDGLAELRTQLEILSRRIEALQSKSASAEEDHAFPKSE